MISTFFGSLLAIIRLVALVLLLLVFVPVGALLLQLKLANQKTAFAIRTLFCHISIFILGIRKITTGTFTSVEGALYVGNHRSLLDPLIAFSFIRNGYAISKAEVANYPVINTGAKMSGVVFVDRENSHSRKNTKEKINELLKNKVSVIIFPEGTISTTKKTLPFRRGAFEAAATNGSPVVYFALEMGQPDRDFWFAESLIRQFVITFSKWRTTVFIHFFDSIQGTDGNILAEKVEEDINRKLTEFQKNWTTPMAKVLL